MSSTKFQSVANNHKNYNNGLNTIWTDAKVRQVAAAPFNWITADEAEAIVATDGDVVGSWYDWQHTQDPVILGQNMVPTPEDWGGLNLMSSEAPPTT